MNKRLPLPIRILTNGRAWAYGLFWSWNLIFLAFMLLGFAPQILPDMLTAVRSGTIPTAFLVYAAILTAIPVVVVILGFTLLRRSPGRLFALGYGVEGPLMLLVATRFFVVRQVTPVLALILVAAVLGIAAYLWQLLDHRIDGRGPASAHLRLFGLTLLLAIGLYISIWIAFYVVPLAAESSQLIGDVWRELGHSLRELDWHDLGEIGRWLPLWILGFILGVYTATLLILMPVAVSALYARAWKQALSALAQHYSRSRAMALTTAVLIVGAVLVLWTSRQPQHTAFALLETPPASTAEAQALLQQEETIRNGLLNAYLAPQRYVSSRGEVDHVSRMYQSTFDMSPERAWQVQQLYEVVAGPVLYQPVAPVAEDATVNPWQNRAFQQDPVAAAELYEQFFDQPIVDGEKETVVDAVRSTWSAEQALTNWQAIGDREVHLNRQEINVTENGDWAEVELYEVYQNQTGQRQEVVYYFSLPESAVVTGVWLGYSADRDQRFVYRVAPRGAAQAVYRNEVRYNRDPALMEQIGPRQYRLRIFPIEPQTWRWDEATDRSTMEEAPPLHLWLTWRVLASDNAWPLPRLAEKRNVYWDEDSVRLVNGESMSADSETWLPASVPATAPVTPASHRVDFPGGQTVLLRPVSAGETPASSSDLRLAVVLDRSRSMAEQTDNVKAALARLSETADAGARVDVYLTASEYRGEAPSRVSLADVEVDDIMYFGGQNAAELLVQFDALHRTRAYDAVFVLTDGSGYELDDQGIDVPVPEAPVWMVHLGGDFPLGYDDNTLQAIQASGGGVTGDVETALIRLMVAREGESTTAATRDVIDGYEWLTVPTAEASAEATVTHSNNDDFAALAVRRLILAAMHEQRGDLGDLAVLDYLHELAIEHSVVTPYSSMIVLVTERQQRLLDELEAAGDRFQREYEEIGETTPQSAVTVTGVPEPEEWLLLALMAAMVIWYLQKTNGGWRRLRPS